MNDKGFFRRMTVNSSLTVKLLLATISVLTIAIQPFRAVAGKTIAFSPMSTVYQERDILSAPDGQEQDRFGRSVAISADGLTLVTGASNDDIGAGTGQGSAYVYELVNGHYIFKQQLFVSGANVKEFGRSVAISGTSIAVGAPGENNDRGAVYVFTKNGASWVQQQRLSMFVSTDGDYFGYSVSLEGDTLAVGSVETVGFNSHQGSAVIFTRSGATWSQQAKLLANDGEAGDNFGTSVSLSGNTVLVGAPTDTIGFSANQGSAYVFVRNGASWSQQQKLTFVGAQPGDGIGYRVALDGDTALVSADSSKVGLNTFQGAAYVFTRSGTNWTKQAKLTANNGAPSDHFGWGVALRGDRALIGAFSKTILSTQFQGAAYVFDRSGNTWSEQQQLTPFVPQPGYFGYSVALGDNSAVVGAYVTNNNTGAIYTYRPLNSHPQISNVPSLNRTAGSGTTNPIIGQVTDAEQAPNTLQMTVNNAPSATTNGVTVSNLNVNASGVLSASVTVGCGASSASFTLRAIDSDGASGLGLLTVNVTPDTPPVLSYSLLHFVNQGSSTTIAPASGPGDNGTINFITLQSVTPAFSGNITVFPTGIVEITNAGPVGNYSITITAHDTCGLVTNTSFSLTVVNNGSVSPNNLQFYPLAHPVRLLDTRVGFTGCDSPAAKIAGGTSRTQTAAGRTCDGLTIPANAAALVGNATSVQSGGGYFTLYPSDIAKPNSANSNYSPNQILNSLFTVRLGANDGAFKIFTSTDTDIVVDITGYYAPPSASGLYFHPLPKPVRLLDTRAGASACFTPGQPIQGNTERTQLGTTTCDNVLIPAGALALTGNATTVSPQANGFLTLYPADAARPLIASANFQPGVNLNSPFMVGLSPSGEFNIYVASTTDLVVDVTGYYSTQMSDSNGQGLLFNALSGPSRLLNTQPGQTACYTPNAPMTGGTSYLQAATGACSNVPATAQAVVGNATTLNSVANGYLTFWPSDANQPFIATSNYRTGITFNRHFTVGLGADGAFKRYAASTTDLVIDLVGYFAP